MLSERARHAAARVWTIRERTELEAAMLFERLAGDLRLAGAPTALVALAREAAHDERVHQTHCRAIVDALVPGMPALPPDEAVRLGPPDAPPARRALFSSVALGCVTESLSTALLLEMRSGATVPRVREALDVIVKDEVRHGRLGWAHLSLAAEAGDVSWLTPHLPAMIEAAVASERGPALAEDDRAGLREHGILAASDVERVVRATIAATIEPGFARYGLALG